jgi:hypothetical protein
MSSRWPTHRRGAAAARRGFQNALVRVEAPELRREFLWLIGLASLVALLWNVYTAS